MRCLTQVCLMPHLPHALQASVISTSVLLILINVWFPGITLSLGAFAPWVPLEPVYNAALDNAVKYFLLVRGCCNERREQCPSDDDTSSPPALLAGFRSSLSLYSTAMWPT